MLPSVVKEIDFLSVQWLFFLLLCIFGLQGCGERSSSSSVRLSVGQAMVLNQHDRSTVSDALDGHYKEWRGVPYRNSGMNKGGIDCSGFVYKTYAALFGIVLPRTTEKQAESGIKIGRTELRKGDLVLFKTGWLNRHIGIYMDNEKFMHASSSKGVMLSGMDDYYWKDRFWQARRIIYQD